MHQARWAGGRGGGWDGMEREVSGMEREVGSEWDGAGGGR